MNNNIPIKLALTCRWALLFKDNFAVLKIDEILSLISLCITSSISNSRLNSINKKKALGSALSPILANITTDHLDHLYCPTPS